MEDPIQNDSESETPSKVEETSAMSAMAPAPDHAHAHGHGVGIPWLDMVIAISVVFISVVSLVVSIEHGRTMQKMVDQNQKLVVANTLPILSLVGRQFDEERKPMLQISLNNSGVGPARIERFDVRYKGVSYPDSRSLLMACCAEAYKKTWGSKVPQVFSSNVSGMILAARQELYPITIKPDKNGMDLFYELNKIRDGDDFTVHACYCSVLDECWETDFDHKRPSPVDSCRVEPKEKLW